VTGTAGVTGTRRLCLNDVAEAYPERVAELRPLIESWREDAEAGRVSDEGLEQSLSLEELEELRSLGYVD
jgi:hypothetical protein